MVVVVGEDNEDANPTADGDSSNSRAATAASMVAYDTMIRWNDRKGENEFSGVGEDKRSRIFEREEAWNVDGLLRFVIRSVLEGGEGQTRGGREVRSRERSEEREEGFATAAAAAAAGGGEEEDWGEPVGEAGGDMVEGSIIVFWFLVLFGEGGGFQKWCGSDVSWSELSLLFMN